jgi:hypothetical protein
MVEIRGGGTLDGAQLIDAASDSTLRELITAMTMQGKAAQAAKTDEVAKQIKSADIDTLTESYKKQTTQSNDLHKSGKDFKEKLDDVAKSLGSASATLASKGITSLFDFFSTGMDSFRQLSTIGAGFNGNLTELSTIALNAGKSVEGFTKEVMANQNSLIALGGSAEGGARKLAEIGNTLNQGQFLTRFSAMGMTLKDITDVTQSYLEIQTRLGTLTKQNTSSISENTAKYAEGIDNVSRALGIQRAELEKAAGKVSVDPVWNIMLRRLGETEQGSKALVNMATITTVAGDQAAESMKKFALNMPNGDALALGFNRLGAGTQGLLQSMIMGKVAASDALPRIKQAIDAQLAGYTDTQIQANEQLQALSRFRIQIENSGNAMKDASARANDELLKSRDSFATMLGNLTASMSTSWNRLIGALAGTELFKSIESNLNDFARWLSSGDGIQEIKRFAGELASALKKVFESMQQGWTNGGIWGAITAGLSSLWTNVGGVLEREFTKLFGRVFGDRPPTPQASAQEASAGRDQVEQLGNRQRLSWDQTFGDAIESLKQKGLAFFTDLPAALTAGINTARSSLGSTFDMISEFLGTLPGKISNIHTQIVQAMGAINLSTMIDKTKESFNGFSDVIRNELSKISEMMRPGSVGPEAIRNFSSALGAFEGPLMSLINKISGAEGENAQTVTSANVSSVLTSVSNFIEKTTQGITTLQNLSPEKMENVIPVLRSIGTAINNFFSSISVGASIGAGMLGLSGAVDHIVKIGQMLNSFNSVTITEEKASSIVQIARMLYSGLNNLILTPGFFNNDAQVDQVVGNIQKFQNINVGTIDGVVTSMNQLKGLGSTLTSDIQGVATFTSSVSALRGELEAGALAAERLKAAAGSIPSSIGGITGANNPGGIGPEQMHSMMSNINTSLAGIGQALANMATAQTPAPPLTTRR